MTEAAQSRRLTDILANPSLREESLSLRERAASFKWHRYAHLPQSSQGFCVSAFGGLRNMDGGDQVLELLLGSVFPGFVPALPARPWEIIPEYEDGELLGEKGRGQATSIDVLCRTTDSVVTIESKFVRDAAEGFGTCSQARQKHCAGFYGSGSDRRTGSSAWCRLENREGARTPRLYWALGKRYFRADVFRQQDAGDACPLGGSSYQLMRNFLFAACMAEGAGKSSFYTLAITPRRFVANLGEQVARFRDTVLAPEFAPNIGITTYEHLLALLENIGAGGSAPLAGFIDERLKAMAF